MIILKKSKSALKTLSTLLAVGIIAIMMVGCGPNDPPNPDPTPGGSPVQGNGPADSSSYAVCSGIPKCTEKVTACLSMDDTKKDDNGLTARDVCAQEVKDGNYK